jgi:hypothetical protein
MATRAEVYAAVDSERVYQDSRWNASTTPTLGKHPTIEPWLVYLQNYLTEAFNQVSRQPEPKATQDGLNTIRKLAGMCVSAMEALGAPRREGF